MISRKSVFSTVVTVISAMLNGCLGSGATTPTGYSPTSSLPSGTSLPFETIMISDEYQPQGGSFDPWIEVVISHRQSVISGIPPEAQTEIAGVDFSEYFAVFVSAGLLGQVVVSGC